VKIADDRISGMRVARSPACRRVRRSRLWKRRRRAAWVMCQLDRHYRLSLDM